MAETESKATDPAPDLGAAALRGARWVGLSRIISETAAFASVVVIAQLVPPAEYGRAAVALLLNQIAQGLAIQGIGAPVVQHRELRPEHIRGAVLLAWIVGVIGGVSVFGFSRLIAPSLFGDRIAELMVLMAPVFLLVSLTAIPIARLQRELDFRRLAMVEGAATVVGAAAAVVGAFAGLDGEALIVGMLATAGCTVALLLVVAPRDLPAFHPRETLELARFGAPATASGMVYFATRNVDYAILAVRLPAAQLGVYVRGFQLGSDYQSKISGVMLRVAFPVFSRTTDLDHLRRVRARMVRVHAAVIFPLLFLLIAVAPVLVPWLFGDRWAPASGPTQILAVAGMAACIGTGTGPLLLAVGRPGVLLGYTVTTFIPFAVAVAVAAPYGLTAVCVTVVVVKLLSLLYLLVVIQRLFDISVIDTLRNDVLPATVAGLALLAVALPMVGLLAGGWLPDPAVVAVASAVGLAVYLVILRLLFAATFRDLILLVSRVAPQRLSVRASAVGRRLAR